MRRRGEREPIAREREPRSMRRAPFNVLAARLRKLAREDDTARAEEEKRIAAKCARHCVLCLLRLARAQRLYKACVCVRAT